MKLTTTLMIGILIATAGLDQAQAGAIPGLAERIDDRINVHVAPGSDLTSFIASFETQHLGVTLHSLDQVPGRPIHLLGVMLPKNPAPTLVDELEVSLETYVTGGMLVAGEFLYDNGAPEGRTGSTYVDGIAPNAFATQYAANTLDLPSAHTLSAGAGIVVAVLDTGLDTDHAHFAGQIASGGYDFVSNTPIVTDPGTDPTSGHGTFVAGLVTLVAPDARILPVRVLDETGLGTDWTLTRGMYHAIDRGVEVINLSLGSTYRSQAIEIAIDEANSLGIVVVAAAGNFDREDPREFPSMGSGLGVAAVDDNDTKTDFSNYSDRLGLSAPGGSALAPLDVNRSLIAPIPGGGYAAWEGTSFAAPLVSATAALIRAQHPDWPNALVPVLDLSDAIEAVILDTSFDLYALPANAAYAADQSLGAGRLDAAAALVPGGAAPTLGDLDADGDVDFDDLLRLISAWGAVHDTADLDANGAVDTGDLIMLLSRWG